MKEFIPAAWGDCWRTSTYRGRPILQNPVDLWILTELIERVHPGVFVEVGVGSGGLSTWLIDQADATMTHSMEFVAVDIAIPEACRDHPRIKFDESDSIEAAPGVGEWINSILNRRPAIILLDDDHSSVHLAGELVEYGKICRPGDWLIAGDVIPCETSFVVDQWLEMSQGKKFEDRALDRFGGLSFHRWMKRGA